MKVVIDGVEYIPAKEALANRLDIAKGLLMSFYGGCSDSSANEMIDAGISVNVNDWGDGIPLREALDDIAKVSEA